MFALTIFLTALTVWIGSRKPARLAVSVSPMEAAGYRPVYGGKSVRKTGKGKLLWRMALQQFTKDKKKSAVIILSLAAGVSVSGNADPESGAQDLCFKLYGSGHGD